MVKGQVPFVRQPEQDIFEDFPQGQKKSFQGHVALADSLDVGLAPKLHEKRLPIDLHRGPKASSSSGIQGNGIFDGYTDGSHFQDDLGRIKQRRGKKVFVETRSATYLGHHSAAGTISGGTQSTRDWLGQVSLWNCPSIFM